MGRPLIAVSGKAFAGKTTLTDAVLTRLSSRRIEIPRDLFAGALKRGAEVMGIPTTGPDKDRRFLQVVGTDLIRNDPRYGPDHWVGVMARNHPDLRETGLAIDDVRYQNEYHWAVMQGFLVVRVNVRPETQVQRSVANGTYSDEATAREKIAEASAHRSETDLDNLPDYYWDVIVDEDMDLDEQVRRVLERLWDLGMVGFPPESSIPMGALVADKER